MACWGSTTARGYVGRRDPSSEPVSCALFFFLRVTCCTHVPRMTEFKPKEPPGVAISTPGPKKKGPQNRRTKRGNLSTVSTGLDNAANAISPNNGHAGTGPTPEVLKPAPQKEWPCLVQSPVYNPDYPTFCECLQPHCLRHCPAARDLLFRRCTDYSWPDPGIVVVNDWMIPPERRANCETGHPGDLDKDPSTRKCTPSINVSLLNRRRSF